MSTSTRRTGRLALVASAVVEGRPVAEARVPQGRALIAGPDGGLCVPAPDGTPWIARARWGRDGAVVVEDGRGVLHDLSPGETLAVQAGRVRVALRLVPERRLRRTLPMAWGASLTWLVIVVGATLFAGQVDVVVRNLCPWFGIACEVQRPGLEWNAEYMARLLEEDREEGTRRQSVVAAPEDERELPTEYLPAGDDGPTDEALGGAEETAPEPVRQVGASRAPREEMSTEDGVEPSLTVPDGTPLPETTEDPIDQQGQEDPSSTLDDRAEDADAGTRAEEERGWGLRDWMDMTPAQQDALRREVIEELAAERLRVDPEDRWALSIVAYHHYLNENLDKAAATYDRLLDVTPEDPAVYNNKALVYKRQGRYAEEEGLYRVALSLDPGDTTALNNLAVNLAHQGRYDEALAIMEDLETSLPDDPYSDLHRAKIHAARGDDEQALRLLDRALRGMERLDTLHHIEFRQDIRVDPAFEELRQTTEFRSILRTYYGEDSPLGGGD